MQIFVDADACPKAIKDILIRAALRSSIPVIFIANKVLNLPISPYIKAIRVGAGFDVADNKIIALAEKGDLVITADIPLADAVVSKECTALNPRGWLYNEDNIKQQLSMRNFMESLRSAGMNTGGPKTLHAKDIQAFANQLDKIITQNKKFHQTNF